MLPRIRNYLTLRFINYSPYRKMFRMETVDLNEICINVMYKCFVRRVVCEKIDDV
jgi:hypothetical protein